MLFEILRIELLFANLSISDITFKSIPMKNIDEFEFLEYLNNNHKLLYSDYKDYQFSGEFDGDCDYCKKDVFFKLISSSYSFGVFRQDSDYPTFYTLQLKCPKCLRVVIKQLVKIKVEEIYNSKGVLMETNINVDDEKYDDEEFNYKNKFFIFELLSIPTTEISETLENIPSHYSSLRETIAEAKFAMNHHKNISATILFRRGLQIIVKDILGAQGKTLYNQLEWLKTNQNILNVDLSEVFHDHSKLVKDIGNQGAHPDIDFEL